MKVIINGHMMPDADSAGIIGRVIAFFYYARKTPQDGQLQFYVCNEGDVLTYADCEDVVITKDNKEPILNNIKNILALEKLD